MARLRHATCYREAKRAYTRISRYRAKSYIKGVPGMKVRKFDMGDPSGEYDFMIALKTKEPLQIRHNALEAFRMSANRNIEKAAGKGNYHFKLKVYPHQIMRHNPTANFAGADRFSSGMKHCYGKPLGRAAILKKGQVISYLCVKAKDLKAGKDTFKIAVQRLPGKIEFEITPLKK